MEADGRRAGAQADHPRHALETIRACVVELNVARRRREHEEVETRHTRHVRHPHGLVMPRRRRHLANVIVRKMISV